MITDKIAAKGVAGGKKSFTEKTSDLLAELIQDFYGQRSDFIDSIDI